MRYLLLGFLVPALGLSAILPDAIATYHRGTPTNVTLPAADAPLWEEYGLKASETAVYDDAGKHLTVTAFQLADPTAAMAAFDWQRPAQSTPSKAARLAVETSDSLLLVHGNYLLRFDGVKPSPEELEGLIATLKNVDASSLPMLPGYLPSRDLVANSERYLTGPVSLQRFTSGIPPSVAAFRLSAEAETAVFHSPKGDMSLAIFNYPTPQIAMQQVNEFSKLPGAVVKRSGPLVALVLSPADADYAERLLAGVRYQAQVTRDEYVPTKRDNIGNLLLNACILIGILLAFSVVSGLALGGFRAFMKRGKKGQEADAMITLDLR